jgi:hypothetical protein
MRERLLVADTTTDKKRQSELLALLIRDTAKRKQAARGLHSKVYHITLPISNMTIVWVKIIDTMSTLPILHAGEYNTCRTKEFLVSQLKG